MRSRRQLAIGHVGRQTTYDALAARIRTEIEAKAVGANSFQSATFDIAEGEEEAVYGWISANYAMGRLEHPAANAGQELAQAQRTKGFLEMGGASLQVAYEVPTDYTRRYMRFSIDHAGFQRDFMVYTREIDNLGAEEARKRYVVGRVPAPGVDLTIDRCWPLGDHPADLLLAGGGVGPVGTGLRPSEAGRPRVFVGELAHSLRPVRQLLPRPFLKAHHPDLDRTMEFVGGACFWHVSQGIYLPNSNRNDKFDRDDIINLILDFASTPWAIHEATIQTAANAKIAGMNDNVVNEKQPGNASIEAKRATLTANEVNFNSGHKRRVLFNAMLTFVTLYIGVRLRIAASFQPYDGVKERTTSNTLKRVSYSWTLGRALLSAIASDVPVAVRTHSVLISAGWIADSDWNLGRARGLRSCKLSLRALLVDLVLLGDMVVPSVSVTNECFSFFVSACFVLPLMALFPYLYRSRSQSVAIGCLFCSCGIPPSVFFAVPLILCYAPVRSFFFFSVLRIFTCEAAPPTPPSLLPCSLLDRLQYTLFSVDYHLNSPR